MPIRLGAEVEKRLPREMVKEPLDSELLKQKDVEKQIRARIMVVRETVPEATEAILNKIINS